MNIDGRVAVVTGGASGLGRATVEALADAGAKVGILDVDGEGVRDVAASLNGSALGIAVDVADDAAVAGAVETIASKLGGVDILVNSAGVPTPGKIFGKAGPLPLEQFTSVVNVNLIGTLSAIRHTVPHMVAGAPDAEGERGVIINISSGAAFQGQAGQAAYAASKAGLIGMTLPLARDLARYGVRVNAIAPGLFETGMSAGAPPELRMSLLSSVLEPKRFGRPSELAGLILHIIGNQYINATCLSIDAGARLS